jgi:predicted ATP-grasp superfamily ATP-dependent carboligase
MSDSRSQLPGGKSHPRVGSDEAMSAEPRATRQATYDALVLDARLRQSLVSVRSLGSRGLRVAALESASTVPAFTSRWCRASYCAPPYEHETGPYLTYLRQLLARTGAHVLITSSNSTIELIRQHREQLQGQVHIALAQEAALAIAVNKERTLDVARRLGLNVPDGLKVATASEAATALREIGLPAVVKPVESWVWSEKQGVGLASKLVTTPEEARCAVDDLTRYGTHALFQRFLPGRREAVSFIYAHGRMHARFAQWAKRTEPPLGGLSVLRQSISIPDDIGEQAECLVREIGLEGYSEVEFRRDSCGRPYLMEINPRLSASVELAVRAGVDFPYLLYQWANGDRIDTITGYRVGGWMRYLKGDIMTTVLALRQQGRPGVDPPTKAICGFCLSCLTPMRYDYFDWNDPLPAIRATTDFVQYTLRRLGRGFAGGKRAQTRR